MPSSTAAAHSGSSSIPRAFVISKTLGNAKWVPVASQYLNLLGLKPCALVHIVEFLELDHESNGSQLVNSQRSVGDLSRSREQSRARKINRTASTVLRVLSEFLRDSGNGFRVTELCRSLKIPKQTVIRCLQTLQREGYIVKRAQGTGYELGYRILESGGWDQVEADLQELSRSTMQRMHEACGETISLAARVGDHTVLLDFIDGRWPGSARLRRGQVMSLNIGPVSRTVLAFLPESEVQDFIARHTPLPAVTANAITDPDELWDDIRATRKRGYGEGVVLPGVYTIGFPIFGTDERPHGAIALIGRIEDLTGPRVRDCLGTLIELVGDLNDQARAFHAGPPSKIGL